MTSKPPVLDSNGREEIRKIWRPLYDLGYKGHEQIDAQYMAMLVSQAVTETQDLCNKQVEEARADSFVRKLQDYSIFDQQKILGVLIYQYFLQETNASTAKVELENFSYKGKKLGNLKITAELKAAQPHKGNE